MQNRYLTGEERNPKTGVEMREVNGGLQRARGGIDLCARAHRDICLPGYACDGIPTFSYPRELDQYFGWDSVELVQAGELESTDERDDAVRKGEGSGIDSAQLQGPAEV